MPVISPFLHDEVVDFELAGSTLDNLLFHCALGDKPVYDYLLLLPDSMSSVDCLQVYLRVPVAVKYDDDVGIVQVDAETTSSR